MSLVPKNLTQDCQDPGKTFRGPHSRVENGLNRNCNDTAEARRRGGLAKPGPTTDTSSRIARLKKLQVRTRTNVSSAQNKGGTDRGAHPSVQNASNGAHEESRRAHLFGHVSNIPGQTSGIGGISSDVIYFRNIFDRVSLNDPPTKGVN